MDKATTGSRSSVATGNDAPKSVDAYVANVPDSARANFDKLRATIRSVVPARASETISYGIPAFRDTGVLVWFAAFSKHCSLFPTASVIAAFKNELEGFTISKGTIQFPNERPLPIALIKKLVKARVAQNERKQER
jgi:uncharacterized protein YdhG (YjbR/CyaY superfamily)